jgi:hypothetical protein
MIQSQIDIEKFLEYSKEHPCRSHKLHRLKLMNQYFELKGIKAHLADSLSPLGKA